MNKQIIWRDEMEAASGRGISLEAPEGIMASDVTRAECHGDRIHIWFARRPLPVSFLSLGGDMNESVQQSRSVRLTAFGDTTEELEASALEEAEGFFPEETLLRVRQDYVAILVQGSGLERDAGGKRYYSRVLIEEVFPDAIHENTPGEEPG
jgi:hypothetical protein